MPELKYPTLLIRVRFCLYIPVEWYYNQDETRGVKSQDPKIKKLKNEIISWKNRPEEDHDLAAELARSPLYSCSPCDLQRNLQHYHLQYILHFGVAEFLVIFTTTRIEESSDKFILRVDKEIGKEMSPFHIEYTVVNKKVKNSLNWKFYRNRNKMF